MLHKDKYQEFTKQLFTFTTEGVGIHISYRLYKNTDHSNISTRFRKVSDTGAENNKLCPTFLGDIAEQVLSYVYHDVERMPRNNPGFDFICGKGFKVDVKSACPNKVRPNQWLFHINKNKNADYFLCLAFDNRDELNPQYLWLIPGYDINDNFNVGISRSTLSKWDKYKHLINKVTLCCNKIKGDENH